MRNLQLLLHLQRLLDGDRPGAGLDELEDLGADDLGDAGGDDLEGLAPILEELDEMSAQPEAPPGDPAAGLDGWEDWLEAAEVPGGTRPPAKESTDDLDRLEALLRTTEQGRAGRPRAAGRTRRDARLQRLIRLLDDIEGDDDSLKEDVRRLRRRAASRLPRGASAGRRETLDPVILRRRGQIREFLAAWRDTLREARRAERAGDGTTAKKSASDAGAPASSPGPRPVRSTTRKSDTDEG